MWHKDFWDSVDAYHLEGVECLLPTVRHMLLQATYWKHESTCPDQASFRRPVRQQRWHFGRACSWQRRSWTRKLSSQCYHSLSAVNILLDRLANINWSEGSDFSLIPGVDFSIHNGNQTIKHRWIEASCQHQHGQQSSAAWPSQERLHRQCRCGWS